MNVLICGASGLGNLGDDAIRNAIASTISEHRPETQIISTRPPAQRDLIRWADKVIIGGGGILYDNCQANFDNYFRHFLGAAQQMGKPVCFCCLGVESLTHSRNIGYLREAMRDIPLSVRHRQNRERLEELGIGDHIRLGDDIAILTRPAPLGQKVRKGTVAIVANTKFDSWYDPRDLIWFIDHLRDWGMHPIPVTLSSEDNRWSAKIGAACNASPLTNQEPDQLAAILGQCDAVFSGRLHGMILGQAGGCPKVFSLGERYKLSFHVGEESVLRRFIRSRDSMGLADMIKRGGVPLSHGSPYVHVSLLQRFIS